VITQQPGEYPRHTHRNALAAEGVVFRVRRRAAHHLLLVQAADVGDRLTVHHALDPIAVPVVRLALSLPKGVTGQHGASLLHLLQAVLGIIDQRVALLPTASGVDLRSDFVSELSQAY